MSAATDLLVNAILKVLSPSQRERALEHAWVRAAVLLDAVTDPAAVAELQEARDELEQIRRKFRR